MRRSLGVLLASALLAAAPACFSVPVAEPSALPVDGSLLGKWRCTPLDAEPDPAELLVLRFDEDQYYAEWREAEKVERYRAYPVKADGATFLSVRDLAPTGDRPWTAVLYAVGKHGVLSLQLPAKRILDEPDDAKAVTDLRAQAGRADAWQRFADCTPAR